MSVKLDNIGITLPFLFVNFNMLNILDKAVTWIALKNPEISELNPIVNFFIDRFGNDGSMVAYSFFGFIISYAAYKVVTIKRIYCEKNNISPEAIFMGLNIIFYFVVINNMLWVVRVR